MMIPQVTTIPIALIRFKVCPHIHNTSKEAATSIGISSRTINELRKEGVPLMEAIHEAGRRRLRPIIMTSLTTIFGMVPLLFTFEMGSELQKPRSIAMISAMLIGTVVSLFIIPLVYWFIYRRHAL